MSEITYKHSLKDKEILVAADFAGVPDKIAVVNHLEKLGWKVYDIGVKSVDDPHPEMFHRIGLRAGAYIAEREFERAIIFCGTGMGIHIAASKCPHVHAAVCENVPSALRAVTGNNCNVLAIGGHYVAPHTAVQMVDAFLSHNLGDGYENWKGFYEFHKLAYDELESFDYAEYKKNGFKINKLGEVDLAEEPAEYSINLVYDKSTITF